MAQVDCATAKRALEYVQQAYDPRTGTEVASKSDPAIGSRIITVMD